MNETTVQRLRTYHRAFQLSVEKNGEAEFGYTLVKDSYRTVYIITIDTRRQHLRIKAAGGFVFDSYYQARRLMELVNPPKEGGLRHTHRDPERKFLRGGFLKLKLGKTPVYEPSRWERQYYEEDLVSKLLEV